MNIKIKAEEAEMLENVYDKWSSSDDAVKTAREAAEAKKQEHDRSKKLQEDRKTLQELKLNKNESIRKKAKYLEKILDMPAPVPSGARTLNLNGKSGDWIRKDAATKYLAAIRTILKQEMYSAIENMTAYFNVEIVEKCDRIMQSYRDHIDELERKGLFDLAGLDVKKIIAATPEFKDTNDVGTVNNNRELVGSQTVAKKGFWNGVKRFFDWGGYEEVNIYSDVEYVFVLDLYRDRRAKIIQQFDAWYDEETEQLEEKLAALKEDVNKRMDTLDQLISELYDAYICKLKDAQKLQEETEKWRRQNEWMSSFMKRIDSLLDIEGTRD